MNIELIPFQTPNYVIMKTAPRPRGEGMVEPPKFKLSEIDAESLSDLCDRFRAEVFSKAGKADPKPTPDQPH